MLTERDPRWMDEEPKGMVERAYVRQMIERDLRRLELRGAPPAKDEKP